MLKNILLVAIGGGVGSAMRYLTSVLVAMYFKSIFPLATFIANVLGCFAIGILIGYFLKNNLSESDFKWLLITGFCGGYTTFSAFALENVNLLQTQNYGIAMLYIAASVLAGLFAVWLGLTVSQ